MNDPVYRFREGHWFPVPPQVIGDRLARLERRAPGHVVTPAAVVADARPERAPLHRCFEWDDQVAAEAHRQDTARRLIRSVRVVREESAGETRTVVAWCSIAETREDDPQYISTARALSTPAYQHIVLINTLRQIRGLVGRCRELVDALDPPPPEFDPQEVAGAFAKIFECLDVIEGAATGNGAAT